MNKQRAVSVIEIVIAIVIIGVVAALTIPRLGQAAETPSDQDRLRTSLKIMRVAIELYHQDHGAYPGMAGDGEHEAGSAGAVLAQLTLFTDVDGLASHVYGADHPFGPYLRDGIPPCPVHPNGGQAGLRVVGDKSELRYLPDAPAAGWLYDCQTGRIVPNSDVQDEEGRAYLSY